MGFCDEIDALPAPRKGEAPQKTAHQADSGATPGTAPGDPAATPAQGGTTTGQPAATRQPSPGQGNHHGHGRHRANLNAWRSCNPAPCAKDGSSSTAPAADSTA